MMRVKKGTLNIISGVFASEGETSGATQTSGTTLVGKFSREEGEVVISFSEVEMGHISFPHEDALVITIEIYGYDMKQMLIGSCSSTDDLFIDAWKKMGKSENDLKKVNFPMIWFTPTTTYPVRVISLPVYLGEGWKG